jgi:hypothetical protein
MGIEVGKYLERHEVGPSDTNESSE